MFSLSDLAAIFMFYAVAGWCSEVIYAACNSGHFVNRGFLNGPVCPIYGAGVMVVIVCLTPVQNNIALLFFCSVLLTSLLEFITGYILEKVFHQKWWDYSTDHFNIKGYVCLKFSLLWGLACVFIMKIVQPIVAGVVDKIPDGVQNSILFIMYLLLALDAAVTIVSLMKLQKQMRLVCEIDMLLNKLSETVGEKLSAGAVRGMEEYHEQREHAEERYSRLTAKYRKKYGDLYQERMKKLGYVHSRLQSAFPKLEIPSMELLTGKVEQLKKMLENIKKTDNEHKNGGQP